VLQEIAEIHFRTLLLFFESPPLNLLFLWHNLQKSICTKLLIGKPQSTIWGHSLFKSQLKNRFSAVLYLREQIEKATMNEPSHSEAVSTVHTQFVLTTQTERIFFLQFLKP